MMTETTERLRDSRDNAAENALDALDRLRASVQETINEIAKAQSGEPARSTFFIPNPQYLTQVVAEGARFEALWRAAGFAEREDAR
jgi:hypothetical protein